MLTMLGAISTFEHDLSWSGNVKVAIAKGEYKGKQCQFSEAEIDNIKEQVSFGKGVGY